MASRMFLSPWTRWPSRGSTPTIRTPGFRSCSAAATPISVPEVPMPATKTSTVPSVWRQISGPVVS